MPSGSSASRAGVLHGMGYRSIPTRRASSISAASIHSRVTPPSKRCEFDATTKIRQRDVGSPHFPGLRSRMRCLLKAAPVRLFRVVLHPGMQQWPIRVRLPLPVGFPFFSDQRATANRQSG
jgi:hypothetical protein